MADQTTNPLTSEEFKPTQRAQIEIYAGKDPDTDEIMGHKLVFTLLGEPSELGTWRDLLMALIKFTHPEVIEVDNTERDYGKTPAEMEFPRPTPTAKPAPKSVLL